MRSAPSLRETQRRFLAALYDDAEAGPLESVVGHGLEPAARLRIYRHSGAAIHSGALRTAYPAVLALVGEAFFAQTAQACRTAYPSVCGNLQTFGQHFADHLAALPAIRAWPYLPDIARLEWLRQASALSGNRETTPTTGPTNLHPSVRLLASRYPVLTIWRYALRPTDAGLKLPDAGERIVLWRDDDQIAMAALDPASFACIESLASCRALADAYQAGRGQDPDFDFAACIESFAERGLLAMRASPAPNEETAPCRLPRT